MREPVGHPLALSTLRLRFRVPGGRPDWPVLQILVDDREPFAAQLPGWYGFDPDEALGERSPLLPTDFGRRVAVCRCTCGIAGCGVVAPLILGSPDGRRITWTDFRDYVGVFDKPTVPDLDGIEGRSWSFPDLHFDRAQYVAEVTRAAADRSWENPRRITARLVSDGLRDLDLPAHLRLGWVAPSWDGDGVTLSLWDRSGDEPVQQLLRLACDPSDPDAAAQHVLDRLRAVAPAEWAGRFGWVHPQLRPR